MPAHLTPHALCRFGVLGAATLLAAATYATGAAPATADDYSDAAYLEFDLDTMARTTERQGYHLTSPGYAEASQDTANSTWLAGLARQAEDLDEARAYLGVGQIIPGGNVGDPEHYYDGVRLTVEFLNREGTKLVGNVWPCTSFTDGSGTGCPLVIVTTGSIQVTQHMYGWLARHLQRSGYTVFTYDVRGQGESETTNRADLFDSNPQDGANFVDGTIDALTFALSTPGDPYTPVGWTASDVDAAQAAPANRVIWANPMSGAVDRSRIALVGHSLGASAVSQVQQCSSAYPDRTLSGDDLPALCGGEHWPIQAIVAYDSLSSGVTPVVPAFDHRADGYFINATPTPTAPPPDQRTNPDSPFGVWTAADVDAMTLTVRGGTHAEWSQIPYIVSATRYGVPQSKYYTQAWLDRYVPADPDARAAAHGRLTIGGGFTPNEVDGAHLPWRASLLSGKFASAIDVSALGPAPAIASGDIRAGIPGVANVGDWAALNAEAEYGDVATDPTDDRSVVHGLLRPPRQP
ncbi:MAG TPA: alpha/beta fold hydrolase [Acidimicrobiales bacterium]